MYESTGYISTHSTGSDPPPAGKLHLPGPEPYAVERSREARSAHPLTLRPRLDYDYDYVRALYSTCIPHTEQDEDEGLYRATTTPVREMT